MSTLWCWIIYVIIRFSDCWLEVYFEEFTDIKFTLFWQNGKDCLGEIIYRYITAEIFTPECLLDCLDLSSEHHILEVANRVEAAVHVWRLKDQKRHASHSKSKRGSWGGKVKGLVADNDKNQVLARRAETLLRCLKLRFPVLPQTTLDMSKIQFNKVLCKAPFASDLLF